MWIGQTLVAENYDPGGGVGLQNYPATVYTPWIPRGGDIGLFTVEIGQISPEHSGVESVPQLTVVVETKNFDEPDSSASGIATATYSAQDIQTSRAQTLSASGLKELVRLSFILSDQALNVARVYCACFRALRPSWQRNLELRPMPAATPLVGSSTSSVPAAPVG